MYHVHFLQEKDLNVLMNLYHQLTGEEQNEKAIRTAFKRITGDDHFFLFGAYDENDLLVGTVSLTQCFDLSDDARDYFSMENFVVDENHRRQGIGELLIHAAEDFAKSRNCRCIIFASAPERIGAHRFYEKMGYPKGYTIGFKKMM